MAKAMRQGDVIDMCVEYFPSFLRSRQEAQKLEAWRTGRQYEYSEDLNEDDRAFGQPFSPDKAAHSAEFENLRGLSSNMFAGLISTTIASLANMEGISKGNSGVKLSTWETFERNRWGSKQNAIHESATAHGVSYGIVIPGKDPLTGNKMSKMMGRSAIRMAGFYDNDDDEWSIFTIEAEPNQVKDPETGFIADGWSVRVFDAYVIHNLTCTSNGTERKEWKYLDHSTHGVPVPPVARLANRMDLDGNAVGEIEPVLPLLRRIDQGTFDRLIKQRFGAWQVRYIAGMAKPSKEDEENAQAMKLSMQDLLVSTSHETRFGVLPADPLDGQISVTDADLRILSAVAQIPPHHLLGLSSNLQAEALAAANEGLQRRGHAFRTNAAEFHEQMARLAAMMEGDMITAAAWDLQVQWRDVESRSLSQTADALTKLAEGLHIPVEMLWEKLPGWTDNDSTRAKQLIESGALNQILEQLAIEAGNNNPNPEPAGDTE